MSKKSGKKKNTSSLQERKEVLKDLDAKMDELKQSTAEMSENMKQLLQNDIKELKKHQKGRSAEIFGVFAKHNFYANGLTPEELRSTLEDLGPTYVKIGQIMSSRVDLLPEEYCKELEKQLAAKPADEKAPAPDSGPSRFVESHVERMKKMAVDDPQRYAQITNRIANWRRRRSEQARSRIDFLSSIDTSRMSAEAREVHEELQQLVARREELEEDLHRHGLDDTKRHGLFQELREIGTKMRELNAKERDNLLSETARNLGFEGSDAAEIVTTVKEVFNATESGWGMPGFGPGGRGPRPRAR